MNSTFYIVVDRGNVRAYRAVPTPAGRPPHLRLLQAFTLVDAHLRSADQFTDEPGAFPVADHRGPGRHQGSAAEDHQELEADRRLLKQLATHINAILRQEKPGRWSFAAPPEICNAVLEEIEPAFAEYCVERVPRDLVKVLQGELLSHFNQAEVS